MEELVIAKKSQITNIADAIRVQTGSEETMSLEQMTAGVSSLGAVSSVNGQIGEVILTASDVGALPDTTVIPSIEGLASKAYVDNSIDKITFPVTSVNGQTGEITLRASDIGALSNTTYIPSEEEISQWISIHNTATDAHGDVRDLINGLTTRLNALADSDDTTLDQMSEIVAYIKSNKSLIESITTSKVNVNDIINNLTTNVSNKPLSAAQGVALKALIDAISIPTKVSQLANDSGYLTSYTETDPTVPAWAKASTKPTYSASEVGAMANVAVTAADNGKFLRVVNGTWAASAIPNAEDGEF